ncbi:thioredoxin-like protein [Crepidotus variabilis]|uniref:Thioredoxin-like protein n=1 Tax=Crepidotus variabilis TaxID=179855 RepID=A0A9P6ES81_9AGAR|nr:thioredoxin-like protein [Crepidotus variabilis]
MSSSKAASLASRLVESHTSRRNNRTSDDEDDDDEAIFAELEEEIENDSNEQIREQGMRLLKEEMDRMKNMKENQHGKYTEVIDEKEVIRASAREPRCVIHFYHSNFQRCEIMDRHLQRLAPKYYNTRFMRVFVENVPWLVEKLAIKVLPCVIAFIDGVTKDRLVGFEELGNEDGFDTAVLELRLTQCGVISKQADSSLRPLFKVSSSGNSGDDEIFDL